MAATLPEGVSLVAEDVYDITCRSGMGRRYRAFLFDGDEPTLVDTTHVEYAETLFRRLDALGIAPDRLVMTHGDTDHAAAFDATVDRYDPETWVPDEFTRETEREADHRFGDADRIGGFTAVHVPGHAPDNYVLVDEARGVAVMADALIGADARGLPPGYFIPPPEVWSVDVDEAERNLERLLGFAFDVGLVFHGSSVTEDALAKLEAFVNFPRDRPQTPE